MTYYAACKAEYQLFNQSYSQLTYFIIMSKIIMEKFKLSSRNAVRDSKLHNSVNTRIGGVATRAGKILSGEVWTAKLTAVSTHTNT